MALSIQSIFVQKYIIRSHCTWTRSHFHFILRRGAVDEEVDKEGDVKAVEERDFGWDRGGGSFRNPLAVPHTAQALLSQDVQIHWWCLGQVEEQVMNLFNDESGVVVLSASIPASSHTPPLDRSGVAAVHDLGWYTQSPTKSKKWKVKQNKCPEMCEANCFKSRKGLLIKINQQARCDKVQAVWSFYSVDLSGVSKLVPALPLSCGV